jgi:hypothetical protein
MQSEIMAGMAMTLPAVYMKVLEGYVAFIEELPGPILRAKLSTKPVGTSMKPSRWF